MKKLLNYIGQLRVYSLVDLILLLAVLHASIFQFIGIILLHIAFLAYLESKHSHSYRARLPHWLSYMLALVGIAFYQRIEALPYLFFSFLYTIKTKKFAFISPIFRGFQSLFLAAGIIGYSSLFVYIIFAVLLIRNLLGDFRDIEKDKKEGMKTLPILIGFSKDIKYIHLTAVIFSSVIWWSFGSLSLFWLLLVVLIEISTYNLTPR